jgi:hypothetical protein
MKFISTSVLLASSALGLLAAYYWWQASQKVDDPFNGHAEHAIPELAVHRYTEANTISINKSAQLNRRAAFWTGISLGLSAAGTILDRF